jgi:hypothetical protein
MRALWTSAARYAGSLQVVEHTRLDAGPRLSIEAEDQHAALQKFGFIELGTLKQVQQGRHLETLP